MLYDHAQAIRESLHYFREAVTHAVLCLSEEPRNEPVCDKLRSIREDALSPACQTAQSGAEEALQTAVSFSQNAMEDLFELMQNIGQGKTIDGQKLDPDKRLRLYPTIFAEKDGEYEIIRHDDGTETKNYALSISFKEYASTFGDLETLPHILCAELKSYGADMARFEAVYSTRYKDAKIEYEDSHFLSKLRRFIQSACTRIEHPKMDETHPNFAASQKLRDLDYRIETATGGGLIALLLEKLDPAEALSAPPPPGPEEVVQRYDAVFKELHELLHGPAINGLTPLRNTTACKLGLQGSVRFIKDGLVRAVKDLEAKGLEFPQYHSVADRGRKP